MPFRAMLVLVAVPHAASFLSPTPSHHLSAPSHRLLLPQLSSTAGPSSAATDWHSQLALWEVESDRIRCPFFRRRAHESLETAAGVLRWLGARHKRLQFLIPPILPAIPPPAKSRGLSAAAVAAIIGADFAERQWMTTGRVTRDVFDEDCYFESPDPDLPVRGLHKYLDAVSNLFDPKASSVELLDLALAPAASAGREGASIVIAAWRLEGVLRLPWRPATKPYLGSTRFTLDPTSGLVVEVEEKWGISVLDAFASALLPPELSARIGARPAPPSSKIPAAAVASLMRDHWGREFGSSDSALVIS